MLVGRQLFGQIAIVGEVIEGKDFLVAGACNHPNLLVLPFRVSLVRVAA